MNQDLYLDLKEEFISGSGGKIESETKKNHETWEYLRKEEVNMRSKNGM